MRPKFAPLALAVVLALVAVAACQPGAKGGAPVNFTVSLTLSGEGSYNIPFDASSTLDGTFGLDYLRSAPVETSAKDDATWRTASDVTWHVYEDGTNCGLGGACTPCDSFFKAPSHDVAVGTRIDSRSGDTAVAYVWIYNDPSPSDMRYHSGCNDAGEFGDPWGGWGPILITATVSGSDVTALSVEPDGGSCTECGTLTIERRP